MRIVGRNMGTQKEIKNQGKRIINIINKNKSLEIEAKHGKHKIT